MSGLSRLLSGDSPAIAAKPVPAAVEEEVPAEPSETRQLDGFVADVSMRLDRSYALLEVKRSSDETFTITGKNSDNRLQLAEITMPRPQLALGGMVDRDSPAEEQANGIRYLMQQWSADAEPLRDWVELLRADVGDESLRLVVWDDSGYEIPWELVYTWGDEQVGRGEGWLGQLVTVTRMVTIRAIHPRQKWDPLKLGDHTCEGDAVAWAIEDMRSDLSSLDRFRPHELRTNLELVTRLREATPVGLVYIAAHGVFSDRMTRLALGGLGLQAFDKPELPALVRSHGLVFMNACHSGRLLNDVRSNLRLFGFAELFLRHGAANVIGTAGKVDTALARLVADGIFQEIVEQPNLPVAEAVRRVRARAAAEVDPEQPDREALKKFIYTFMYVCYGNPFTRLAVPAIGAGDE